MFVSVKYKCLIFISIINGIIGNEINDHYKSIDDARNYKSCCPVPNNGGATQNQQLCGTPWVQAGAHNQMGAHPWVARVAYIHAANGHTKFPCSGSILNNRVVLTAAHCALHKFDNYKLLGVRVGEWCANTDRDCNGQFCAFPVQDIPISYVIVHPGYDSRTFKDNIALLVLNVQKPPIQFSATVKPICLPQPQWQTPNYGILVGWGRLAGQYEPQQIQQTLHLPIVGLQLCSNHYKRSFPITDLCVGGQAGRDACEGFLGSPLIADIGEVYFQIGILSFGSATCGGRVPSMYLNLKYYVNWILANIP